MIQIFFVILMAGVSFDFQQLLWKQALMVRTPPSVSFLQMNVNRDRAAALFRNVNVMYAAPESSGWLMSRYFQEKMPRDMMISSLQVLASADHDTFNQEQTDSLPGTFDLPAIVKENSDQPAFSRDISRLSGRQVAFYCTHTAETYTPDSGKPRLDGKRGLVTAAARAAAESLEKRGIQAAFYDRIHDFPEYDRSYSSSRNTIREIVKNQSQVIAVFDIHRDHIPGLEKADTVKINGKKSARILIIVGTDERKPHPNWEKNLAFAESIAQHGEAMYPGLIKAVRTKSGTYNQEFHDRALLIELGSDQNTLQEAQYAARLFSDILIEVLLEETE